MAFDINQLKKDIKGNTEETNINLNGFIDTFTQQIESEDFEDWLQEQLRYTGKYEGELYFHIGIFRHISDNWRYKFAISPYQLQDNCCVKSPICVLIGEKYISRDEALQYRDALHNCWNILRQKLKSLGLNIDSTEPEWDLDLQNPKKVFKAFDKKIEISFIED